MSKQSRVITTVLSPAVRFWLRSQLEHVEDLQFAIEAGDRQILAGCIGRVSVSAQKAVYQGLHLSRASLVGEQIRTNLRQVLRGQPLRLLESFPIAGEVQLQVEDLNASLQAPLLGNAVLDFLMTVLKSKSLTEWDLLQSNPPVHLKDPSISFDDGKIVFSATLAAATHEIPIVLQTGLHLENKNQLRLYPLQYQIYADRLDGDQLVNESEDLKFDLGSEVVLEVLRVEADHICCRGQVMVIPEA